jgi:TRAP-type C4-dicarboxylate transport system permease small subunit
MCPHCGFHRGEASEEQLLEFQRRRLRDRVYHLKMASYAVMSLFLAAFGWYWWESSGFQAKPTLGPMGLIVIAAVAYLVNRVLLFQARRKMRQLLAG